MTDASKLAGTPEQWVAGNAWAKGLKVGDTFRGSHGEADHRDEPDEPCPLAQWYDTSAELR